MFSELVLCRKLFPIRYCCHRSDHELKLGAHIQAINMSGHDDGIQCSNGLGTILGVAKEPIYASDHKIANQPFNSRGDRKESEVWNNRAGSAWPEGRAWRVNRERFFTPPLPDGRDPLVSVIMPAYNEEAYIAEAVSSILNQSWKNLELIVVDDGSTDATAEVVRGFADPRLRLLKNKCNLGIAASMNRAIEESRGEYIALMDGEDVSLPDRLKAQVTVLENNREIAVLGTGSACMDAKGQKFGFTGAFPADPKYYRARLMIDNVGFCNSTAMIRKAFLEKTNLSYREGTLGTQNYRFYMEASKHGAISCLADTHHRCRVRGAGSDLRIRREFPEERAQEFNSVRCDSLRMSGVKLSGQEEALLGRLLPEGELPNWNRREREALSDLFAEIREQLAAKAFPAIAELDEILWLILNH